MRASGVPTRLTTFGYGADDVPALTAGALNQPRLIANCPLAANAETLGALYRAAM